jgi:hypothetical protein
MEYGLEMWPKVNLTFDERDTNPFDYYYTALPNKTGAIPGLETDMVSEVALWQYMYTNLSYVKDNPKYNTKLDAPIPSLEGAYTTQPDAKNKTTPMQAIGVRCVSSSSVGMALLDGRHSTFTNFVRTDTPPPLGRSVMRCAGRFDQALKLTLPLEPYDGAGHSIEWASNFFSSSEAAPTFYASYNDDDPYDQATGATIQPSYLQASDLRKSLLRAYATYATDLIYNSGAAYSSVDGLEIGAFTNTNVTAFSMGKVLQRGVIPMAVPGVLLVLWALGSMILGCVYGLRKRWATELDGYSMFRFGADFAEQVRDRPDFGVVMDFEDCNVLSTMPGMIGDIRPDSTPGHISLVVRNRRNVAAKRKRYV